MYGHLVHRIFFIKKSGMKYLLRARCFIHHIAKLKHLCSRQKQVLTVIDRNQRCAEERTHIVVRVQLDCLGKLRTSSKIVYPIFIHSLNPNLFSFLPDTGKHEQIQFVIKAMVNISVASLWCSLRIESFMYSLQKLFRLRDSRSRTKIRCTLRSRKIMYPLPM